MVSAVLYGLSQRQLDAFEDALAAAKEDIAGIAANGPKKPWVGRNLERFLQTCLEIPGLLQRYCDSVLDLIAARVLADYEETSQEMRRTFAKSISLLDGVAELVKSYQQAGGVVQDAQALQWALTQIRTLESNMLSYWPDFSEQDIQDALDEQARGDCLSLDDGFARIAGLDKETWLRRVADRKNAKPGQDEESLIVSKGRYVHH